MKLLQSLKTRQALLRQVGEAAAQEERNRLARDLHDSIKQQLFSINVSAAAAQERWERDPDGARAMLADVRRSAKEAMVEMQALLHQLRPEALSSIKGFIEALREQCEALGYRSGAQVTVELGQEIPEDRLSPGTPEALFRIAQEALANVARHARARQVRVGIGLQREVVVFEVMDDGQGFDPETASPGMGLRNLRERADSLGGTLKLASAPGAGTTVTAWIPLAPLPSPNTPAIEIAIHRQMADLLAVAGLAALYLGTTPPDAPYYFGVVLAALLFGSATWNWTGRISKFHRAAPEAVSRLRHAKHRSRAFHLFVATCWCLYIWSLTGAGWTAGRVAWGSAALLSAVWAGVELASYHRQSRLRKAWPKWTWDSFLESQKTFFKSLRRYQNVLAMFAILILALFLEPQRLIDIGARQLLWVFPVGAVLVYLFLREPRLQGADR